ncbi:alanine racemase [Piscirickettsia litoralis]|uniref:Alanine racemase n=1 Tax=Piscirickettsia litoralis TaxID=1891921 RepID=A0ABX3A589_9GAMM|nr:alanine racemase [Piscirickettsia litoralis]ODN42590.1 alanine racemase [Piscirickettsia litoralis]
MARKTQAHLSRDALLHNLNHIRSHAPGCQVVGVVKANAYGHGLEDAAKVLAPYVDYLGVAAIEEAMSLIGMSVQTSILLMEGIFQASELELVSKYNLEIVVHEESQIVALEQAEINAAVTVWLKLDTGLGRLGFAADQARVLYQRLQDCVNVKEVKLMSHFSSSDTSPEYTEQQLNRFIEVTEGLDAEKSIANGAAIFNCPKSCVDIIRPGGLLYGVGLWQGKKSGIDEGLRPVMNLRSHLISVKDYQTGDYIGYGMRWQCPGPMRVGVVAIGYGDGYPVTAPDGTPTLVGGIEAPLIGRVSMDMITVDLVKHPQAQVGDEVTLWGDGLPVERVAHHVGVVPYALLCAVAPRVKLVWDHQ